MASTPRARTAAAAVPAGDALRAAAYQEFMYGYGAVPGVDLGRALSYRRDGQLYCQEFEHGHTVANVGASPADVVLAAPHADADGTVRTRLTLPPHSAEVLRAA